MYEFERMLVADQAARGELLPRQYQLTYIIRQTINVLTDGQRVTGWSNDHMFPAHAL
jgi:hypothetical protein